MKLFLSVLLTFCITHLHAADVEVSVEGVSQVKGTLMIAFYDNANDFRVSEVAQSPKVPITKIGTIVATAKDLKPGVYAVAIVWDLNNNGILDTKGRFKIPVEPYGFSNNPKSRFGPPAYEKCTFRVTDAGGKIQIVLK